MRRIGCKQWVAVALLVAMWFCVTPRGDAAVIFTLASLVLENDVNGDGTANFGDRIRVTVVATSTTGAWAIPPEVDLSTVGLGGWRTLTRQGVSDTYQDSFTLSTWRTTAGTPNYQLLSFPVRAWDSLFNWNQTNTNSNLFDLCNVNGNTCTASPNPCRAGQNLTISIVDSNYQNAPNLGTRATVDLSPIGLGAATTMTYMGGNTFSVTVPVPAGRVYTGPFTVTLSDPFAPTHPAQSYQTNNIVVDSAPPVPTVTATVMSGNVPARPGDVIRLGVTVPNYDNDTVTASASALSSGAQALSTPPIITATNLPLTSASGLGNPASWTMDIVLLQGACKNPSLPITFTVTDAVGNVVVRTIYINVDLDPPNYSSPRVVICQPSGSQFGNPNFASAGCHLQFIATITSQVTDTLTVTVDLTGIGGPNNFQLDEFPPNSNFYIGTFTINFGTSEDTLMRIFTVTARDTGGNIVYRNTTPSIGVDNAPPSISGVTLTKVGGGVSIIVGDQFTVQATVTGLELGSVTVDLRPLGFTNIEQLVAIGANTYQQTFTLPAASEAGIVAVDSFRSFVITANDTLNFGSLYGHNVTVNTPGYKFDNEPPRLVLATYTCTAVSLPDHPRPRIGDVITLQVRLASSAASVHDGESVTVNLTDVGGSSAQAMSYDGVATYSYSFTLATGTKNLGATFTCTIRDDDGNYGPVGLISVPLDNVPPSPGAFTITKPDGVISIGDVVNFTLSSSFNSAADPAKTEFDLSMIGSWPIAATTVWGHDGSGNFSLTVTAATYTAENPAYQFAAFLYDDSGNRVRVLSNNQSVDCRPPSIDQTNTVITPDNPKVGIANLGDSLLVWAKISQYDDALSTIARLSTSTPVFRIFDEKTMTYNSTSARWEAVFPIRTDTSWDVVLEGAASYTVIATDDAGNKAEFSGNTWPIDNTLPTMASFNLDFIGLTPPGYPQVAHDWMLNVGTYTMFDRLVVRGTMNQPVSIGIPATINLTPLGGSAAQPLMNIGGGGFERSSDPLRPVAWGCVRDLATYTLTATFYEESGNSVVVSADMALDTKRPQITSSSFNGETFTFNLSEDCGTDVHDQIVLDDTVKVMRIHGRKNGVATFTLLLTPPDNPGVFSLGASFDVIATYSTLRRLVQWDSTSPLWMSIATGVVWDLASNGQTGIAFGNPQSITITDNTWRTRPTLTSVSCNTNWPASVTITMNFNKPIDPYSVHLYRACIVSPAGRTAPGTFDYRYRYHFHPASDTFITTNGDRQLIIELGRDGRDWVARKLGSQATTLSIAIDGAGVPDVFLQDKLGLDIMPVTYAAPVTGPMNQSPAGFRIVESPRPVLNLASSTLTLYFYDRGLLSTADFGTTPIHPTFIVATMAQPVVEQARAVTTFNNRVILHSTVSGAGPSYAVKNARIDVASNTDVASTQVVLSINQVDMQNILNLRRTEMFLEITSGAFHDLWGYPNQRFLTAGPGTLDVIKPTSTNPPVMIAMVLNTATSPMRAPALNSVFYEVEILPGTYTSNGNNLWIPINQSIIPTLQFQRQEPGSPSVEFPPPVFDSWVLRTLNSGIEHTIARFRNAGPWTSTYQRRPAFFTASGVVDVFGGILNPNPTLASHVYSANQRTAEFEGFIPPAMPLELDNQNATVTMIVPSNVAMGGVPAGSATFRVTFSEIMDPNATPTMTLRRGAETLAFVFSSWNHPLEPTEAIFANALAISNTTTNGTWSYYVDGARDLAGNPQVPSAGVFQVFIQTQGPALVAAPLFTSLQPFINAATTLTNATYSPYAAYFPLVGNAASITCTYVFPAVATPHTMQFYYAGSLVGLETLSVANGGYVGTASVREATFLPGWLERADTGPVTLDLRIVDSLGNTTGVIGSIVYDSRAPAVTNAPGFTISNVGSFSNGIAWYNPARSGAARAQVVLGGVDSPLRLVMWDWFNAATSTWQMNEDPVPVYVADFGATCTTEMDYWLFVADSAGNRGTGANASRTLRVDMTAPTVAAATCTQPASGFIGVTPAGGATFEIDFADLPWNQMHRGYNPTLALVRGAESLPCDFVTWLSPLRARFVNRTEIRDQALTGTWNYQVSGAVDLALNPITTTVLGAVEIRTQIPTFGSRTIITQQETTKGFGIPVLFDRTDLPYSDTVRPAIATITFTYSTGPFNPPHLLQIYEGDFLTPASILATTIPIDIVGLTGIACVDPASVGWPIPRSYNNVRHTLRVVDIAGNAGGLGIDLYLDNEPPVVNAWSVAGAYVVPPDTWYYSPNANPNAAATVTVGVADTFQVVISTTTAPLPASWPLMINASATALRTATSFRLKDLVDARTVGRPDGEYLITVADAAGNLALAGIDQPHRRIIIDSVAPSLVDLAPTSFGTGTHLITLTFDEGMDPTRPPPTLSIATTTPMPPFPPPTTIPATFVSWLSGTQAQYRTTVAITRDYPQGSYTATVSGGTDFAGNVGGASTREVTIFSRGPIYVAQLQTQQQTATNTGPVPPNQVLIGQPFSPLVLPGVATLTITYAQGPYGPPHRVLIVDATGRLAGEEPVLILPGTNSGIASLSLASFNLLPPGFTEQSYTLQIIDANGNVGLSGPVAFRYDAVPPTLSGFTMSTGTRAPASTTWYYSPLLGSTNLIFTGAPGTTEGLRLAAFDGVATYVWPAYPAAPTLPDATRNYTFAFAGNTPAGGAIPDGEVLVTAIDSAGNLAGGAEAVQHLVLDRVPPQVTITASPTLHFSPAGALLFQVLLSSTDGYPIATSAVSPTLVLSTGSAQIELAFAGWAPGATPLAATATFRNVTPITATLTQGLWQAVARGVDLAGNEGTTQLDIPVNSRGPDLNRFEVLTWQATTASAPPPAETLINQPFSPAVLPGQAQISIGWPTFPATPLSLNFRQGGLVIASHSLVGVTTPAGATFTYNGFLADGVYELMVTNGFGDPSLFTGTLTQDTASPSVVTLGLPADRQLATGVYYFNPAITPNVTVTGSLVAEPGPVFLRARGVGTTDTYPAVLLSNAVVATFSGVHDTTNAPLPDGQYVLDLVDAAGNPGRAALVGATTQVNVEIDRQPPPVTGYQLLVNGVTVSRYNPNSAAALEIIANSVEPAGPTGGYEMLVLSGPLNSVIRRLPVTQRQAGISVQAVWDGRAENSAGFVGNGTYRFLLVDLPGNQAATSATVIVNSAPFTMVGVSEIRSDRIRLEFNSEIDANPANLAGMALVIVDDTGFAAPAVIQRQFTANRTGIDLLFSAPLRHGRTYTVTVQPGTLRSADQVLIAAPRNTGTVLIDAQGPVLTGTHFEGLAGQREINVTFDEVVISPSAETTSNYNLTESGRPVAVVAVALRPDQTSVQLTAAEELLDTRRYTLSAVNVVDSFGNAANGGQVITFVGRDLTPPQFTVGAFSNPANEYNITIVVAANENLAAAPVVRVTQAGGAYFDITLIAGSQPRIYHGGVFLDPNQAGSVQLEVRGRDLVGNEGVQNATFATAQVQPSRRAEVRSTDGRLVAVFDPGAVSENTFVKLFARPVASAAVATGGCDAPSASRRRAFRVGGLPRGAVGGALEQTQASVEVIPTGPAYEVAMPANRLVKPFTVRFAIPGGQDEIGLGLFALDARGNWSFVGKVMEDGRYRASSVMPTHFAVMRDLVAPAVTIDTALDPARPLLTDRPEISGTITDGTGVDVTSIQIELDGVDLAPSAVLGAGTQVGFRFVPPSALVSGEHTIAVKVRDVTGNQTISPRQTFTVEVPLKITEIQTFPNPASRFAKIRLAVNRRDLDADLVEVKIYDVRGARVGELTDVRPVLERSGVAQRYLYDIPWDLNNAEGRKVANGVYLLRIKVRDPQDPSRETKVTHKVAVLR